MGMTDRPAENIWDRASYLVGGPKVIETMADTPAKEPFAEDVVSFLSKVSDIIRKDARSRAYADVMTFAFWIRPASLGILRKKYGFSDSHFHLGRGVAFHIAPSNVPVNFAYSLAAGLLAGNANMVRVPSKPFLQVSVIADALNQAVDQQKTMEPYIVLARYGHDKELNDAFSAIADIRVVWGGDATIAQLRKSPLPPRSTEIAFADRYSLAVIDADQYLADGCSEKAAKDFYHETYLFDQNACTSPRMVVWTGEKKQEAKEVFWNALHKVVETQYTFQDIQGVDKLTSAYLASVQANGIKVLPRQDNLIVRVHVEKADARLMHIKGNSGYFYEYDCEDVMELREICDDRHCQTIGVIGDKARLYPLVKSGVKGVDRIVAIGHMMDFDLAWDGYDLVRQLSRVVT